MVSQLVRQAGAVVLLFAAASLARADITLGVDASAAPGWSLIAGFLVRLDDPALKPVFSGSDKAPMGAVVRVESLVLTARKGTPQGKVPLTAAPMRLKVYEDTARTRFLGEAREALRWDSEGAAPGAEVAQTYHFENLHLRTDTEYAFVFETEPGPVKPVGDAGVRSTMPSPSPHAVQLRHSLKPGGQRSVPDFRFTLSAASSPPTSPVSVDATGAPADEARVYYRMKLADFDANRWAKVKPVLEAIPGVVRVQGKRTGELLIECRGAALTRADVDAALRAVNGGSVADMRAMPQAPEF